MIKTPTRYDATTFCIYDVDGTILCTVDADANVPDDQVHAWGQQITDSLNNHAALLEKVERLEAMLGAAKRIQGEYWHVEQREGENGPEWYAENPQILLGPFDTALAAYESLKGGSE